VHEPAPPQVPLSADRLDSWKDIAAYLRRDVSTVQRWEKREGMPVHRHLHDKLGSVYAFRWELDVWSLSRKRVAEDEARQVAPAEAPGAPSPAVAGALPPDPMPVRQPVAPHDAASSGAASPASDAVVDASSEPGAAVADAPDARGSTAAPAVAASPDRRSSAPEPSALTSTPTSRAARPRLWAAAGVVLLAAAASVLEGRDLLWRNPLADAQFRRVTDFEGSEQAAAISRDGRFLAFLADRDGPVDVWVGQLGTGQFHNLTRGRSRELVNASVRTLGFSPDSSLVYFWVKEPGAPESSSIGVWTVPTLGGPVRPFLKGVAELDWSSDGTALAFHTPAPGDPLFIRERDQPADKQIFEAVPGLHAHFPVWSPDGAFVYFVQGRVPDRMDIWRIPVAGGTPERVTAHDSKVSHPVFLDRRTLLYLATTADGSRAGLHAVDVERRVSHPITVGAENYTSLAGSADGKRLAVTVASSKETLWRVPISEQVVDGSAATRLVLPTASGRAPRLGQDSLLYVSSTGSRSGLWKVGTGPATELWSAPDAMILGGPAISPDGRRVAFVVEARGRTTLHVLADDGTPLLTLAGSLQVRGAPAWSPDGASLTVATDQPGGPRLVNLPLDGGAGAGVVSEYSADPQWSPDGRFLAYSGPDVGTTFEVKAATPDGAPYALPELKLSRGARRIGFLPDRRGLVVLRGALEHKDFWLVDLPTGTERRLTELGRDFVVVDFDVSFDGRELVFERQEQTSDIVLIDRP